MAACSSRIGLWPGLFDDKHNSSGTSILAWWCYPIMLVTNGTQARFPLLWWFGGREGSTLEAGDGWVGGTIGRLLSVSLISGLSWNMLFTLSETRCIPVIAIVPVWLMAAWPSVTIRSAFAPRMRPRRRLPNREMIRRPLAAKIRRRCYLRRPEVARSIRHSPAPASGVGLFVGIRSRSRGDDSIIESL